ncbi:MAG: hypothetical protein HGA67_02275 [Candidatus Yonathbacteria bacterium]|nr:hypothetical protein [Candidatus Yonathbacteria bacterium]
MNDFRFPFMDVNHPFVQAILTAVAGFSDEDEPTGFVVAVGPSVHGDDLFTDIQTAVIGNPGNAEVSQLLLMSAKTGTRLFQQMFRNGLAKPYYKRVVGAHDVLNGRVWAVAGFESEEMNRAVALCYGLMETLLLGTNAGVALDTLLRMGSVSFGFTLVGQWRDEAFSFLDDVSPGEGRMLAEIIPTVANLCFANIMGIV